MIIYKVKGLLLTVSKSQKKNLKYFPQGGQAHMDFSTGKINIFIEPFPCIVLITLSGNASLLVVSLGPASLVRVCLIRQGECNAISYPRMPQLRKQELPMKRRLVYPDRKFI